MTRLQNAEKKLSDALASLESALKAAPPALSPVGSAPAKDLSGLVNEVSQIEAKLGAAIAIVAAIDAAQNDPQQNNDGQNTAAEATWKGASE